ncbi:MAG TPA: membrane protein insertion efficiency factor YidD [Candidatus Polarisedimenticolia bacterium]|nr:membrane protein insertion efficiency factor YidD [Candidatus Polarisedimenticolia bacterium]
MQNADETFPRLGLLHSAFFLLPSCTLQSILILLVRLYRLTLSPAKTFLFGPSGKCRFEPSCSQYAVDALKIHGPLAGSWLAAKRVCRCHPWGNCGADPVPAKKFRVRSSEFRVSKTGEFRVPAGAARASAFRVSKPKFRV